MKKTTLTIRADASIRIGSGHIMRCLALAEAWKDDKGEVTFLISEESCELEDRIRNGGFDVIYIHEKPGSLDDAKTTISVAKKRDSGWLVIDGYHFTEKYWYSCSRNGIKLLCIDDYGHTRNFYADIILNPNIYASTSDYPDVPDSVKLLLGPKFFLLRKEFIMLGKGKRTVSNRPGSILVTMGGTDPDNVCLTVLEFTEPLIQEHGFTLTAITGKMNPHINDLRTRFEKNEKIIFLNDVADMPSLINKSDIIISGAGTTAGEIAFMGAPAIIIVLGENQKRVAEALHKAGAALTIGDRADVRAKLPRLLSHLISDREIRKVMSKNAGKLIDGEGAARVIMHMKHKTIRLRTADASDCKLLWEWANDPDVRRNAFNQQLIDLESHIRWFKEKQKSPKCDLFLAVTTEDIPVGQIRFDHDGTRADVDISVDMKYRGHGLGVEILKQGISRVLAHSPRTIIHSYVKADNISSVRMFKQAGFTHKGRKLIRGSDVYEFIFTNKKDRRDVIK